MIVRNNKAKDLLNEIRSERGQREEHVSEPVRKGGRDFKPTKPQRGKPNKNEPYQVFLYKYERLEEYLDKLSTRDLLYYFREKAEESGYKFVITNIKRDMAVMKRAREHYENRDICAMIEFLYTSDQDYLDKETLSPNLLVSSWVNTIYYDTQKWLDDDYVPKSKKTKHPNRREWQEHLPSEADSKVKIGEWD